MAKKVLLVEGSATEALRAKLILDRQGHEVLVASSGVEAIEAAASERPDLIVLDAIMPRLSGYEIWERLMSDSRTADLPVLMVTTAEGPASMSPNQGLVSSRFLVKPYAPEQLVERVERESAPVASPVAKATMDPVLGALGVGRVVVKGTTIEWADEIAAELMGKYPEEVEGEDLRAHVAEAEDVELFDEMIAAASRNGGGQRDFRMRVNGHGDIRWWRMYTSPVPGEDEVTQVACIDITERRDEIHEIDRLKEELGKVKAELGVAARAKSDFLATISHELRTPIHEFMGMNDLVLATDLTEEQRGYLERAQGSARELINLVDDMIEYTEITTQKLTLDRKPFEPRDVIDQVVKVMDRKAKAKGIEFSCMVAPQVAETVIGDPRRIRQVLATVVDNAIKFTQEGSVDVMVGQIPREDGQAELRFMIDDTGCGIPEERLDTLFDAFELGDGSTTRIHRGAGIGLAMTKQLIDLMDGVMDVESEVGEGTCVRFTAVVENYAPPAEAVAGLPQTLNILLAEDSPTNQLLATANLQKAGHTVTVAKNGRLAVEAFEGGEFDIILMDVAMPEMDGIEATLAIREIEAERGGHIPIVAMTAFAMNEYREKCAAAGMDSYATKPISVVELNRAIAPFMMAKEQAQAENVAATETETEADVMSSADIDAALAELMGDMPGFEDEDVKLDAVKPTVDEMPAAPDADDADGDIDLDGDLPVDLGMAFELAGYDLELMEMVVDVSLDECPRLMDSIRAALDGDDAGAMEHAAHTLKGTVANIGAGPTRELCQRLETMGVEGDLTGASDVVTALEPELERLIGFYRRADWKSAVPAEEA